MSLSGYTRRAAGARVAEWGRQRRQLMPLPERIFPVSSAAGLMGMDDLLAHIKQTVENPECFPQLSEQIPTSYFQVRLRCPFCSVPCAPRLPLSVPAFCSRGHCIQ